MHLGEGPGGLDVCDLKPPFTGRRASVAAFLLVAAVPTGRGGGCVYLYIPSSGEQSPNQPDVAGRHKDESTYCFDSPFAGSLHALKIESKAKQSKA